MVRKTFSFDHTYVLKSKLRLSYKGAETFAAPAWPAGFGDEMTPGFLRRRSIDYHNDASTERSLLFFQALFHGWLSKALAAAIL